MTKKRKQPQQQRPFKGQKHGFQSSSKTATTAASCQEGDRKHVTMQDEPQRLKTPHAWSMKKDVPFKPEDRILLVGEGVSSLLLLPPSLTLTLTYTHLSSL